MYNFCKANQFPTGVFWVTNCSANRTILFRAQATKLAKGDINMHYSCSSTWEGRCCIWRCSCSSTVLPSECKWEGGLCVKVDGTILGEGTGCMAMCRCSSTTFFANRLQMGKGVEGVEVGGGYTGRGEGPHGYVLVLITENKGIHKERKDSHIWEKKQGTRKQGRRDEVNKEILFKGVKWCYPVISACLLFYKFINLSCEDFISSLCSSCWYVITDSDM